VIGSLDNEVDVAGVEDEDQLNTGDGNDSKVSSGSETVDRPSQVSKWYARYFY
jgi:hypothetical protein